MRRAARLVARRILHPKKQSDRRTAGCTCRVPIRGVNRFAERGKIHFLDRVLQNSLKDVLENRKISRIKEPVQ
jgi:hypothetical protein